MLDSFEILTTSGVVLWSKSYNAISPTIVNSLITDVFIEERVPAGPAGDVAPLGRAPSYQKDHYTLKWKAVKDLKLIFVAVYQSLLHLSWVDKLLDNISTIFLGLYRPQLQSRPGSVFDCPFDNYFDQQIRELEDTPIAAPPAGTRNASSPPPSRVVEDAPPPLPGVLKAASPQPSKADRSDTISTPLSRPDVTRSSSPANHLLSATKIGPGGRTSRRARKAAHHPSHASSGDESRERKPKSSKNAAKEKRRWDGDGLVDEDGDVVLDYSQRTADGTSVEPGNGRPPGTQDAVDPASWGTKTGKGEFVLKDLDDEVHSILSSADRKPGGTTTADGLVGSSLGAIGGLFRNMVGGKTLTKKDLEAPMKGMEEHLLKKNVAREAAVRLCEGVEQSLIGVKTGSFQSVENTIRIAMEASLRKILTPTTSLDLLRSIQRVNRPPATSLQSSRPYVISIVGVNGVGKSTNLSKICFFLLQNQHKVLIAACDTFRSGAVEQLRVHARNLKELGEREGGMVELYEKGYGKDAANIARDAVAYAADHDFSVVLIDTAGRRHNDARLMSSLEKFAKLAQPDKILMVGEALVGTDSVQQARNFNAAFGVGRHLDGFIISKCDTVGDMVGTLVSMVHATGIPVVFLGTGQHYSDLRTLNIGWAVQLLMS
ncbi:MAG: hypothetical protein M1838_000483 [Thelocarpon superellum]|nr:MAG: hypothetical protein M1838_000483 [Thelocarpon superellum]